MYGGYIWKTTKKPVISLQTSKCSTSSTGRKRFFFSLPRFQQDPDLYPGDVSYCIEGHSYELHPYDVVFVKAGEIHRPVIHSDAVYERIIIYVSPDFISSYQNENYDLNYCFKKRRRKSPMSCAWILFTAANSTK